MDMSLDLNKEIDAVVARLSAGEDPRGVLTSFARSVRGSGNVVIERDVYKCPACRTVDAPCFRCKAVSVVGEQGVAAAPLLMAKLGPMLMGWAAERKAKQERSKSPPPHPSTPPPPSGKQRF